MHSTLCRCALVFLLLLRRPPSSTLFPYTTLFRSDAPVLDRKRLHHRAALVLRRNPSVEKDQVGIFRTHGRRRSRRDRKSTRLNSSHQIISYAVFCLKKKIDWPGSSPSSTARST